MRLFYFEYVFDLTSDIVYISQKQNMTFQIKTESEENGNKFNSIKQEYELEISDLKQDIQRLQENNESSRSELNTEYQLIRTQSANLETELASVRESNQRLKPPNQLRNLITAMTMLVILCLDPIWPSQKSNQISKLPI